MTSSSSTTRRYILSSGRRYGCPWVRGCTCSFTPAVGFTMQVSLISKQKQFPRIRSSRFHALAFRDLFPSSRGSSKGVHPLLHIAMATVLYRRPVSAIVSLLWKARSFINQLDLSQPPTSERALRLKPVSILSPTIIIPSHCLSLFCWISLWCLSLVI